jgi:hypothetical protein
MFFLKDGATKEDLFEKIKTHSSEFTLRDDYVPGSVTPDDVIEAIRGLENLRIKNIDELKNVLLEDLSFWEERSNSHTGDKWYKSYVEKTKTFIREVDSFKEKGLVTVFEIGFGDNDGDISGTGVGSTMDYEGRNIYITEKDFAVRTEQNR